MTLGEKIKRLRKQKKMTQATLAENLITRNMLSQIENDVALPSLSTLRELANRLGMPVGYLLSEKEDELCMLKAAKWPMIVAAYRERRYEDCIGAIDDVFGVERDNEIALLYAESCLNAARNALNAGSMAAAVTYCDRATASAEETVFDTRTIEACAMLITAAAGNPQSPRLEMDEDAYRSCVSLLADEELYHYLCDDLTYAYRTKPLSVHAEARQMMQAHRYHDAYLFLADYVEHEEAATVGAFVLFRIYGDMETCARNSRDFENAYRMSVKRMSMLTAFRR